MVRHIVLTRCAPGTSADTIGEIYAGLRAVSERLPGATNFTGGPSNSPEDLERGYTHGFSIDFDDHAALRAYADDPEHRALGARLVEAADGGIDGLLVVDLEV